MPIPDPKDIGLAIEELVNTSEWIHITVFFRAGRALRIRTDKAAFVGEALVRLAR